MASYVPAKVSTQYVFYVSLVSQANTKLMQVNPTIASGDFKVSIDGGALANLGTLPTVTPASSAMVKITLSTSEMAGANATVVCSDAAGAEWCDLTVNIPTAARQVDDLAYPATSGRSIVVDAAGLVDANVVKLGPTGSGTAQTARDIGASVLLSSGTGTGQLDFTSGVVKANATQILGGTIPAVTTTGVPKVDVQNWTGTAVATPATAGVVEANVKNINNVSTSPVTTVKAVQGLAVDGVVTTVTNQLTAAQIATGIWQDTTAGDFTTAASIGKSVMNGVALGTGLTINGYTGNTVQTGDAFARIGAAGAGLTAVGITSNVKKNQALAKFQFLMTDTTNHNPVTGKTVTVTRSIDNGSFGAGTLSAVTEIGVGMYSVDFGAGDLNGNVIVLQATATGSDTTFERIVTQP